VPSGCSSSPRWVSRSPIERRYQAIRHPLTCRAVIARGDGEAHGEHLRTAESNITTSRVTPRGKGRIGNTVRDAARPIGERNSASRRGSDGSSSATAPIQHLSKGGKTTETVSACHSASLLTSWQYRRSGREGTGRTAYPISSARRLSFSPTAMTGCCARCCAFMLVINVVASRTGASPSLSSARFGGLVPASAPACAGRRKTQDQPAKAPTACRASSSSRPWGLGRAKRRTSGV
jgi:hypothetical protein